jgi:hypothetical protein
MSQNPYEAIEESGDGFPPPGGSGARPVSVKVFGILNLVFAVMGICGVGAAGMMFFADFIPQDPNFPNPTLELMKNDQGYRMFTMVSMSLALVFTIVLAIGGVGLLQWRRLGRTASIVYGWYAIISVIVTGIVNYFYIYGPLLEQMNQANGAQATQQQAVAIITTVSGLFGFVFALIYPALLLVFMNRRKTIDALS